MLFLLAISSAGRAQTDGRVPRVLILYPYDEHLAATSIAGEAARKRLIEATGGRIDLFSEFLDLSRFPQEEHVSNMAGYLAKKYASVRPDVVLALGIQSIRFIIANRAAISPDARIIFCGIGREEIDALKLPPDIIGAFTEFDITKTFDMATRLQPNAKRLVVIAGSSAFDKWWIETAQKDLAAVSKQFEATYLSNLSIGDFAERASKLSPDTIVLFLSFFRDGTGRNFTGQEALQRIAPLSGAPIYSPYSTLVGHGAVGGSTVTFEDMGAAAARLAIDAIGGKMASIVVPQTYLADARQLERWGFDKRRLPQGTVLLFEEQTLWEQHYLATISVLAVVALQALIISTLLVERRRRAAAEQAARKRLLEVVHLNQSATAGALSASIAHELNQPLGAIRNNAAAAEMILNAENPDLDLMRQILADIRDDDQRAGDIIGRLRGMLKKRNEIDWQEFDVNEVVSGTLQILHGEAERRNVLVDCVQAARQLLVRADRIHVQQVILNIATNALDAMLDTEPARRMLMLRTELTEGPKVAVSISDTGNGIPNEQLGRVFETFYTTKPHGTGLGLPIARAIVETYGGKIWASNRPEGGATVSFVLPAVQVS